MDKLLYGVDISVPLDDSNPAAFLCGESDMYKLEEKSTVYYIFVAGEETKPIYSSLNLT